MAEEISEAEEKPKKPLLKIILAAVGLIVLVIAVMIGTLFMTGFFAPKPAGTADQQLDESAGQGEKKAGSKDAGPGAKKAAGKDGGAPGKLAKKSPELTRFEYSYHQLEREFLVNLAGSRKVMSVQIAVMTHYDERVITNVKKHEFAVRSVVMDVMRQTTEADLLKPDFRKELANRLRDAINTLIEKYEDFGGIEDVYFTSFIVQ